jgi:hypothetical protein
VSEFPWPLLGALVALFTFFGGIIVMVIAGLLRRDREHSDRRFGVIEQALQQRDGDVASVRDGLAEFKLKVAETYVHREDFVRVEGARSVILSNVKEEVGEVKTGLVALTTLVHERLPAKP